MKKNRNLWSRLKPYLLTTMIVATILTIIFFIKGIYPFGNNSLIWGDMHDQITAFYYHLYDSFKGNSSLLIDFSTSGGINFWGILAYYILSPFSLLVLLVDRTDIYLMVSVIIALKILCCSLTCLFFIRTFYKKLPNLLSVLLAIIYAFSSYGLIMYQITSWIDVMYLFPLIVVGLKKVLDLEKPTLYIVTLSLALIFSFYVAIMVIIFIFLASFIYLLVYKEEKVLRKKAILALGITTVLSLLLSSFVLIPSYLQISISSRLDLDLETLFNSKMGPITDKVSMFMFGGIMYVGLLLLLKKWKPNKKFLLFYIPTILIVMIPVFIEPINKVWHFGSYAFFPYRFGFIAMFLLILGACQGFSDFGNQKLSISSKNKILATIATGITVALISFIMYKNYNSFQQAIETLTISINHSLLFILFLSTVIAIGGCIAVLLLIKQWNRFSFLFIFMITLTHITANSLVYLGLDQQQESLMQQYQELGQISKDYSDGDYYRVKNELTNMIMNSGMVMKYHTLDHFTSLTDRNNLESLKKLGYSSMWVKTFSKGGNLFLDSILANKYIMTRNEIDSEYYSLVDTYGTIKFYALKEDPSYGYLLNNNDTIFDKDNSFLISNSLYQNITGTNERLFDIIKNFDLHNIQISTDGEYTQYEMIDPDGYSYFEKEITIVGKQTIYLEALRSLVNNENYSMYEKFNIYINDKLYRQRAFSENDNGVLNLGTYENEKVNIKIELRKGVSLSSLTIGVMDNSKYEKFIQTEKIDTDIQYQKNKIYINVDTESEKILFLPISYNEGYTATNNGEDVEIIKLYDNFIGIKLNSGNNNIRISFIPKNLLPCVIISIIAFIFTVILISTNLYQKILDIRILNTFAYYLYLIIYLAIITIIYVGLIICFIVSYFVPIQI